MNKIFACASLALSAVACHAQGAAADGDAFAHPHQLVDVGDHRLNLFCSGSGSPTVVFEAPSGTPGWAWWAVQPRVAEKTRACVYDRAGFGFSDPATRVATSSNQVDDLHALLVAADIKPPYVLVGNSLGGANVQLYAWRYPAEVKGLVLVEPMNEDGTARLDAVTHGGMSKMMAAFHEEGKACVTQASKGFAPGSDLMRDCVEGVDPAYRGALASLDLANRLAPAFWQAGRAEVEAEAQDEAQLRDARKPFGDLPLIVLIRGVSPFLIPGKPQSAVNKAIEADNLAMQQATAKQSTRGSWRVVAGAGHMIQQDKPEAVVTAVDDLLAQIAH